LTLLVSEGFVGAAQTGGVEAAEKVRKQILGRDAEKVNS
jgi:hypothetical protein